MFRIFPRWEVCFGTGGGQERHFDRGWIRSRGWRRYAGNWKIRRMSIMLAQFGVTMEDQRVSEIWSGNGYGLTRNATRKDSGGEAWLFRDVLELPRYWSSFQTFLDIFEILSRFVCTGNGYFAYDLVLRNGLWGCVCFSKPCNNVYLFALFRDQTTYLAFMDVSGAETFKWRIGVYNLSIYDCSVYFSK